MHLSSKHTWAGKERKGEKFLMFIVYLLHTEHERTGIHLNPPSNLKRAALVAQMVKNLPAMQETWVQSLGQEDPLEEGMETHSSILAWRIP